ncbi:D-alanyl-D-alanine carboxypeptidase [Paenibacillus sp. HN-1]|uniref:D-alanyl-D-alanine carboxypeptidase family protein n=1 Tax=Paenibacillus TaxID=44249 RepID=UPI001CAA320C|nr:MULTISPECIES: D-alanyl-D-alanine carboxypeptidase family protein [Paenibacillus]MBY9081608.1 D-alanyl-D-alanine carboxypeptidase [Paenibacillus sp. CGMCC 1.18879]MBY9083477.1 D-alanyl-D-alanine carboxypeptidase [Paenibacillus sinensis]
MKNVQLRTSLIWILCGLLLFVPFASAHAEKEEKEMSTHAKAAALIDVESGRILYSSHGDEPMLIASLTKIMTAIVAIENGDLSSKVTVGRNAYAKEGSSLFLKQGEQMTLENMLYGLMLRSGNDAATAIAEHVGGSEAGFVYLMNAKAEELGLTHTHFQNPHGLDAKEHYSTANDLAVLTAYAMHNPVFKEIVKTQVKTADNPNDKWDYKWLNKNKMLRLYEGADGVKTGYTKKALRCLVSSATRNGQQLVAVTLNDGDDWNDHAALLNFGFKRFPLRTIVERGDRVQGYPLAASLQFSYPFGPGEEERLVKELVLNPKSASGSKLNFGFRGVLVLKLGSQEIGRVPIYEEGRLPKVTQPVGRETAAAAHPAASWLQAAGSAIRALFDPFRGGGEARD